MTNKKIAGRHNGLKACLYQVTLLQQFVRMLALVLVSLMASTVHAAYKPAYTEVLDFTHYHVNADGSSFQTMESSIRIETDRGVSGFSEREIYYNGTYETVDVLEAYTLQPDGTKLHIASDKIRTQDAASDSSQIFSDSKVKVMIYPQVKVGSVLHYKVKAHQHTPTFPGHFAWSSNYSPFLSYENVEVVITHDPAIALSFAPRGMSGGPEPLLHSDMPGSIRHRYTFRQTDFVPPEPGVIALADFAPRFAVSSFKTYSEVAQAYQLRARPKADVTPDVELLARSLTTADQSVEQKSRSLYNWVSKSIRYVGVYVGAGGYVPHSAQSILDNRYGDCKDHVVLLEALLRAVGIESSPVLIHAGNSYRLPDLPTPYAFNHAITFIPALNLYLDSTAEFAPFGLLPQEVMQQPALIAATGIVSQTPLMDANKHYAETHTTLALRPDGSVAGSSTTKTFGYPQIKSRAAQAANKDKEPAVRITNMLYRFLESGTGKMDLPDPRDLDAPWVLTSTFELDPLFNFPGPSAMTIPVGIAPGNIKWISMARANLKNKFPESCTTTRHIENTELVVPKGMVMQAVPKNVSFQRGALHYKASYTRKANTLNVRRELLIQRAQRFCMPSEEKDWLALTQVMKQDLRGQIFLR
jgi:hypothetical protein